MSMQNTPLDCVNVQSMELLRCTIEATCQEIAGCRQRQCNAGFEGDEQTDDITCSNVRLTFTMHVTHLTGREYALLDRSFQVYHGMATIDR